MLDASFQIDAFGNCYLQDPFIVLSCLSNSSNSLSGNNLSLSSGLIKDASCSAPLTVVSISLEVISIISIASASVVDEDSMAFDLSSTFSSSFLSLILSCFFVSRPVRLYVFICYVGKTHRSQYIDT